MTPRLLQPGMALVLVTAIAAGGAAHAEDEAARFARTLSGDWNGLRAELVRSGVDISLLATNDAMAIVDGGVEQEAAFQAWEKLRDISKETN